MLNLEQFNNQYKYKTDKEKFGFFEVWDIPKLQDDGFYYGDCEDYCIFLKHNFDEFEHWDYYYCTLDNQGHCVLIKDNWIIDCNSQKVMSLFEYQNKYKVYDFKKYNWFVVLSKFIFGKILKTIKGY